MENAFSLTDDDGEPLSGLRSALRDDAHGVLPEGTDARRSRRIQPRGAVQMFAGQFLEQVKKRNLRIDRYGPVARQGRDLRTVRQGSHSAAAGDELARLRLRPAGMKSAASPR